MFTSNNITFKGFTCRLDVSTYASNGRLALILIDVNDGSYIAVATTNLTSDSMFGEVNLRSDIIAVKDWGENEGMKQCLIDHGIAQPIGLNITSGFVSVPLMVLSNDFKVWLDQNNTSTAVDQVIQQF